MPRKCYNRRDYSLLTHDNGQYHMTAHFKISQILDLQQQWVRQRSAFSLTSFSRTSIYDRVYSHTLYAFLSFPLQYFYDILIHCTRVDQINFYLWKAYLHKHIIQSNSSINCVNTHQKYLVIPRWTYTHRWMDRWFHWCLYLS